MILPELRVEYSDKKVTAWGGMKLMHDLVERMGIKGYLQTLPLPARGSNHGYDPEQILECFWVSVWIGASRFTHSEFLRYDKALQEIFGWARVPSQSTYSRFFHKFSWKRNAEVFESLFRWFFEQVSFDNLTLDLDSTVMTRYGSQEGAKVGYNPQKPGRASHHPLMAFMADLRMVVNAWLRPGNTGSSSNYKNFLTETLSILQNKRVGLVRADSGFFSEDFCNEMEDRKLNYITAVPMYPNIKSEIGSQRGWVEVGDGIEVVEWEYRLPSWKKSRRMIAVRKQVEKYPKASGKLLLFDDDLFPRYRYSMFVTNLDLPAELVWNLYRDRGDAENRIKELKYDFGADSFCLSEFFATEASFRFIMMAYNLMSVFRQLMLKAKNQAMLSTLRFKCFALGAWICNHATKRILKIALAKEKRAWLDGLFNIARNTAPPYNFSNA